MLILLFFALVLARHGNALVGGGNRVGLPLVQPTQCVSGNCVLSLGAMKYDGPVLSFTTRGYNGNLPGPTIRVRAGDTFNITLVNELEDIDNTDYGMNEFRHPNTTNLHTHGLHSSSKPPGDNVFVSVKPLSSHNYSYSILDTHMGGTYWYHPHLHGCTALQIGGGAFGNDVIEYFLVFILRLASIYLPYMFVFTF
jgi:hypothetical protein